MALKSKLALVILSVILLASCAPAASVTVIYNTSLPSVSHAASVSASPEPSTTPVTTPIPTPVRTADPIGDIISGMSDKELVGQMVMMGLEGTRDMDENSAELMSEYGVGGILLFGWNTDSFSQTRSLVDNINSHNNSEIPLLIGIDLEGGRVTRFGSDWKPSLFSAYKLGSSDDIQMTYEQYRRIGLALKELGINIDLAPVMDISPDPLSTFIGNRMFGSDPEKVSALVREAVKGLHDAGIASLGKHFPGHGGTTLDSHKTLPVIEAALEDMKSYSLVPFQASVDEGIDAMLVAHLKYPDIDPDNITSLSPFVITELLRNSMGFEGVIISDDLRMKALTDNYTAGEGAVRHILAGGDMVLIGRGNKLKKQVLDSLYAAVQEGRIPRGRLKESVRRILELKGRYCGLFS